MPGAAVITNDLCVTMMIEDDAAAAVPILRSQLERPDPAWIRPFILNNLGSALAMLGGPDSLAEAEDLVEQAIRLRGVHPMLLGTRACVFAQCGRADE